MSLPENPNSNEIKPSQAIPKESFGKVELQSVHVDEKTGFFVEDNDLRRQICGEIDTSIAGGKNVAIMKFDLDNLKQINDVYGRSEGDRLIKASPKELKDALNALKVEGIDILLCRQDHAGDEFVGYLSGFNESQAEKLREIVNKLSNRDKGSYSTLYSMTGAMRTSLDEEFTGILPTEKQFLKNHPGKVGWEFFNKLKNGIDKDINMKKDQILESKADEILLNNDLSPEQKEEALEALVVGKRMTGRVFKKLTQASKNNFSPANVAESESLGTKDIHFTPIDNLIQEIKAEAD